MIDWNAMEIFVTAAHLENFSAAAQQLHLSQPAVTQRIQNLERHYGVPLFERRGRRVVLSEAGAYLLPMAEDLLRRCKRMDERMQSLSGQVVGHLQIGCSTTSGKYILPRLIARFREQHPGVRASIRVGSRARVIELLLSRDVQLAFSSARIEHPDLSYLKFVQDDVVLIAPPDHWMARKEIIEPAELLEANIILREKRSGTYQAVAEALEAHDINPNELSVVMTLGNSEAIIMAVEEGVGVGFVPRLAAERFLPMGKIAIVPIHDAYIAYTIWMVSNTMAPATAAQIHFTEMIRSVMGERTATEMLEITLPRPVAPEGENMTREMKGAAVY